MRSHLEVSSGVYKYLLQHTKPDPDGKLITDCSIVDRRPADLFSFYFFHFSYSPSAFIRALAFVLQGIICLKLRDTDTMSLHSYYNELNANFDLNVFLLVASIIPQLD